MKKFTSYIFPLLLVQEKNRLKCSKWNIYTEKNNINYEIIQFWCHNWIEIKLSGTLNCIRVYI